MSHRRTWQKAESRAASLFGASRQPGSGSMGRDDQSRSDSTHPRIFLECKYRERHAVRSLLDSTCELAQREGKFAVVGLFDKGRPGFVVAIHSSDIEEFVIQYCAANATDALMHRIQRAYAELHGHDTEETNDISD